MRAAYGFPDIPDAPAMDIKTLRRLAGQDAQSCAAVKVSAPVVYRGRTLVEIPDITEPDLRLANRLIDNECNQRAVDKIEAVLRATPDNRNANYIVARMSWGVAGMETAEQELTRTLEKYPDFASAKVLLAAVRFEQQNMPEVVRLLDEAEPRSPTDLWIYMSRLRVETFRSPSRDLYVRLLEIARNPAFPLNARDSAANSAKYLPNLTPQEFEGVLRARVDIDAPVGIPMACKVADLAFWLSESQHRYDDVIKLLESPRGKVGNCRGIADNRVLLAQAYLMKAAKINAGPSPANQVILDKVDALLNGDFTGVAAFVTGRPQAATLAPFLEEFVHPLEETSGGVTRLCQAINQLDTKAVRAQLDAGADPNGKCQDESLVGSVMYMATRKKPEERRDILSALLEHGAPLRKKELEGCRSKDMGDCSQVLLPVMEKYAARAK